jgi:hypothetical protein
MVLCLISECTGGKQIVLSAIQSKLPALKVAAIRLIFGFVHDGRSDYFTFDDLKASLSMLSSEEELMSVAKFLSFCWDTNNRRTEDVLRKREEQKKWFLNRLQELWPQECQEELARTLIKLSDKPIPGSASVDITNAYLIPLAEHGHISYDLIGKVWLESWFNAVKSNHISLEFPQLNHVAAWYMTEHSSAFWNEAKNHVSECLRILSHPLADLINYREAKASRDSLIKIASFVLLCRDAQGFEETHEPPLFQWHDCANDVLDFAKEQAAQARPLPDSPLDYYEKIRAHCSARDDMNSEPDPEEQGE